tara:strand:- start:866 stop:1846 length:981 start_codon:yes stop_codon:yes gene_type:complete
MKKIIYYTFAFSIIIMTLYYNYNATKHVNQMSFRVEEINNEISSAGFNEGNYKDLEKNYNDYIEKLPKLVNYYESDDEYLNSLEIIEKLCKRNRVGLIAINPNANNTIRTSYSAIPEINSIFERYELNLKVNGNFLSVGKLLESLSQNNFFIKDIIMKPQKGNNLIISNITLIAYVSMPKSGKKTATMTLAEMSSLVSKSPSTPLPSKKLNWGGNIFTKQNIINEEVSDFKIYSLTRVSVKNKSAEINFKTYKIGSKIDEYILTSVDNLSATLSNNKRSIILALEKNEISSEFSMQGFKRAFLKARNNNQSTFTYKGKQYNTSIRK